MLNSEIKSKIDNARDILVGKIPVPSQQIEQITIALIYKFMSDIDKQTRKLGGQGFFEGEYSKYSWDEVMDRKKGGPERLNLYSEGLDKMGTNPHLPQMFRDIFRNAYLPFKDPSTLDMFLKQIDEFSYDHSEDLGDAFEYLLSTAGSQGDAGQFRTPRHIIDFIVSIVQPQLTDTVFDPACGTAGFLISAYKYIMNQNKDKVAGDKLSLTQKKELTQHFVGYDISYEMVRLSLVNMYLHNFGDPKIYEYDTLSNDDRWDDRFDCILANPPFMTPKGGIQPHNRFSIKASKSEVLFVDYMIEHLNPHGKAGIVVPEGIIFQGANAYKDLRKKMIKENFLWAVVSLPAGVFQPYSGVKTSILLFDQELAKKTDKILFVKVQNDGFDLGAQRRPINKNDLPKATEILLQYKKDLFAGNEINLPDSEMTLLVSKEKIEENSEFNLSMDKYREKDLVQSNYDLVKLGDICEFQNGYAFESSKYVEDGYQVMRITNVQKGYIDSKDPKYYPSDIVENELQQFVLEKNDLLISLTGNVGRVGLIKEDNLPAVLNQRVAKIVPNENEVNKKYLYHFMNSDKFEEDCMNMSGGIAQKNLGTNALKDYEIPLPPLEVQEKIVAELDGYQKVIDGAKMIVNNYKPTIKINPDWEMVKLGDYININNGDVATDFIENGKYACIKVSDMNLEENCRFIKTSSHWLDIEKTTHLVPIGSIVFPKRGAAIATNKKRFTKIPCYIDNNCMAITLKSNGTIIPEYLFIFMLGFDLTTISNSAGIPLINNGDISGVEIPLPTLEEQNQIVAEIEKEEAMVESAKQLIEVFEKKIKDRIDEILGK